MAGREAQVIQYALQRGILSEGQVAEARRALAPGQSLLTVINARLTQEQRVELSRFYRSSGRQSAQTEDTHATLPPAPADVEATIAPPSAVGSSSSSGSAPERAETIGPYRIVRELARGGMGVVYVARRSGLDRDVALKLLLTGAAASSDEVERFLREARISARLRHPHIVAVHDVGEDQGRQYFVMDLIKGRSLKERIDAEGPLSVREAAEMIRKLAEALSYAHSLAVLHRDLKPHNVLLDERGEPLLTDFGLAKDVQQADDGLTQTGQVMGTPAYMPPEQAEGQADLVDRRSDVYSLGATLYQALTGAPPFEGATALNILTQVFTQDAPSPRRLRPEVDRDLETICLKCLEKDPGHRYASAQALADDLARYLADESIVARRPSAVERARRFVRRNRVLTGAVVVLLMFGIAGAVASSRAKARAEAAAAARERAQVREEARQAYRAARAADEALQAKLLEGRTFEALQGLPRRARRQILDPLLADALKVYTTAQRWRALTTEDSEADRACIAAALRLATLARWLEQWTLGAEMVNVAESLGAGDEAEQVRRAITLARTEGARRRRERIQSRLTEARERDPLARDHPQWRTRALLDVTRNLDDENVSLLTGALSALTAEIRRRTRERTLAVGGKGLEAALQGWLIQTLKHGRPFEASWIAPLRRVHVQLSRSSAPDLPAGRWVEADLACDALGHVELGRRYVEVLGAYCLVHMGGPRMVAPAQALQRLDTQEARRFLRTALVTAREVWGDRALERQVALAVAEFDPKTSFSDLELDVTALRRGGRFDEALRRVTAWRRSRPEHARARALLALLHLAKQEEERAEALLAGLEPILQARTLATWAEILDRRYRKHGRALALYGRALAKLPNRTADCAEWLVARARIRIRAKQEPAAAEQELDEALRLRPDDPTALRYRAEVYLTRGRLRAALDDLNRAIAREPVALPMAWILRGQAKLTISKGARHDAAFRDLNEGVRLGPHIARVWCERGVVYAMIGELEKARVDLDQALRLLPAYEHALMCRAKVWTKLGRSSEALADYDRLLNLKPRWAEVRLQRGRLRAQAGDIPGAVADLEEVQRLAPRHPRAAEVNRMLQRLRGR